MHGKVENGDITKGERAISLNIDSCLWGQSLDKICASASVNKISCLNTTTQLSGGL